MSQAKLSCPKCQDEMIRGYIVDFCGPDMFVSQWAEGMPQKSWMGNLKVPTEKSPNWLDVIHYKTISIGTFRCRSCGFLESYAREEFDAK